MTNRFMILFAAAAVLLLATPASAQVNDEAFSHFEAGAKAYGSEDYRGAIVEFREGYEIQAHPMFQVNIALAHWRLGELLDAIAAADLAAVSAEDLGADVAGENSARRATFSILRVSKERASTIAADLAAEAAGPAVVIVEPPAPEPKSPLSTIGWIGVGVAGAGGALLVGWAVAEVGLSDDLQRYERAGEAGDQVAYDQLGDDFRRKQTTARILLASGAGLLTVGGGLLVYDLVRPKDETRVTLTLSDGPGLVLTHQF